MQFEQPYELPPEFRQQPLSARMLDDYATCPRKFLLSFFISREEEQRFRGGPAVLHQAVRGALVDCYSRGGPAACDPQVLADGFEARWQGELCTDSMEERQLHEQGLQMLQDYYADHCQDTVEVVATDHRFEGVVEGQAFVAVADVIVATVDGADVVRFSTSRRPESAKELAEAPSARLLWLLAHESPPTGTDQATLRVLYYALRLRSAREVVQSPDQAAGFRAELAAQARRLYRDSEFAPIKSKACRWCRVRSRCPLWQTGSKTG